MFFLATVVLGILKLAGVLAISWWLVAAPAIVAVMWVVLVFALALTVELKKPGGWTGR